MAHQFRFAYKFNHPLKIDNIHTKNEQMFRLYMVYHKSFLIQEINRLIKEDFTQIRVINLLIK